MKKIIIRIAWISAALTLLAAIAQHFSRTDLLLSAAITLGTVFFHFSMRLFVGYIVGVRCRKYIHPDLPWFSVTERQQAIFKRLKVQKWKKHLPTYDPDEFSMEKNSLSELIHATCAAELVHEIIILLSFLPLLAAIPFHAFPVFLVTSLLAAAFDSLFVILQRYNRPRLIRILQKTYN